MAGKKASPAGATATLSRPARPKKPKEIRSYVHPPEPSTEAPDTKPGDYYVTVLDGKKYGFLLGPFRDDHAAALDRVSEAWAYVSEHYPRSAWWAFGTARLDSAEENPVGKLNETLGFPEPKEA